MVAPAQVYASFWFDRDDQDRFFRRLGRTLTVSLALHVVALLVVMGLRLTPHGERPLAAVEVNLVNLPTPVKTVEQPRPVEAVKRAEAKPSPASAGQDGHAFRNTGFGAGSPQRGEGHSERLGASARCAEIWRVNARQKYRAAAGSGAGENPGSRPASYPRGTRTRDEDDSGASADFHKRRVGSRVGGRAQEGQGIQAGRETGHSQRGADQTGPSARGRHPSGPGASNTTENLRILRDESVLGTSGGDHQKPVGTASNRRQRTNVQCSCSISILPERDGEGRDGATNVRQ